MRLYTVPRCYNGKNKSHPDQSASACTPTAAPMPCSTLPPAFLHPLVKGDDAISGPAPPGVEKADEEDKFLWPTQMVFLLLSKFEEYRPQFDAGEKTQSLWLQIVEDIKKLTGSTLSHSQLQSKLNGLKNRYKIILARKGRSGRGTIRWPYLERMEELFGRCAWANPKATADERGPIQPEPITRKIKKTDVTALEKLKLRKEKEDRSRAREEKRMQALQELMEMKERHHKEKMDALKKIGEALAGRKLLEDGN
ncbi:unnamed protein product [Acanthoscelides obtectus]|uniref:Myb/SANT-like DNA-binding domain-containing protein n=1 Tax=Acanthoscelides obtectus TaxID=200917 RepID=A0A9P0KAU7_ACAOB|nr:unnamed protein product [Acanthoscelides obtectus]CAK1660880.1 hypothetical protein AOBTE_LOCUS22309 [Acanthoscelides obtectus]